jgi:predicted dienelactone hydrolase
MKSLIALSAFLLMSDGVAFAAVKSVDVTLHDPGRNKELECRVHFPETGGNLPLIVFSHGFGGDKTSFAAVSQYLAGQGYAIVHPSHADGLNRGGLRRGAAAGAPVAEQSSGRRFPRPSAGGGGLVGMLDDPVKIEGRVNDVVFLLDSVEQLVGKLPALRGRIDTTRIGVGGHSYGACTAMLVGGVTTDLAGQRAGAFADRRVRCIMPVSPQGTGQMGLTDSSWAGLKVPMLTVTGSRDQGAAGQSPEWRKEPFQFSPPGDKYLLFIEGANHLSFGGGLGTRGSAVTEVVKAVALAFWNAYLKDDARAKGSLADGTVVKPFEGSATIESK